MIYFKNITILFMLLLVNITLGAQSYFSVDRHSTNPFDGWISCETGTNPNSIRGTTHWIMYDLGQNYMLSTSMIWNVNHPENLDDGIQNMHVDYSRYGDEWIELGIYTMPQSDGSLYYEGEVGPNFNGVIAQYILFTAIDNYGGDCYGFSELKINVLDPALPIELVMFEVSCEEEINYLTWETAQEYNLSIFEIERSIEGSVWETISTIEGKGAFQLPAEYSFEDKANKPYYYRLKAIDLDDEFSYSSIVVSDCKSDDKALSIYPNPTDKQTTIGFKSTANDYEYFLYDVFGRVVETKSANINSSYTEFILDVSTFVPGDYYITINMDDQVMVKKIVVF